MAHSARLDFAEEHGYREYTSFSKGEYNLVATIH